MLISETGEKSKLIGYTSKLTFEILSPHTHMLDTVHMVLPTVHTVVYIRMPFQNMVIPTLISVLKQMHSP